MIGRLCGRRNSVTASRTADRLRGGYDWVKRFCWNCAVMGPPLCKIGHTEAAAEAATGYRETSSLLLR